MLKDDTDLMLRVKEGDEGAFKEIVDKYQKPILDLCFRYVGNQQDAEEVAQDVFFHLYRSASKYEPTAKLSTFLYKIGVNLSLNRIRDIKRKRLVSLEAYRGAKERNPISSDLERPDTLLEQKEKQKQVWKALEQLPKNQKTAVILKRFEDLSYEEIAKVMDCSVSAVESLLHRAKQNLQKKLNHL